GSILSPANQTMLAAIKPTVGRISRHGIIPLTADQDTAGPLARTVADAAIVLGVLEDEAPDPKDPLKKCVPPPNRNYTRFLKAEGLKGARAKLMADAIEVLRARGAVIVDPADIPSVLDPNPERNFLRWEVCRGSEGPKGK